MPPHIPQGRRVTLRPVIARDYEFLYLLATTGENSIRWRFRGATPSPEHFGRTLWDGVLAQYIVQDKSGAPIGLVGLYNANFVSRYCYGYALTVPGKVGSGRVMEGLLLLVHHGFELWEFEKIYFEVPEFNLSSIGSVDCMRTRRASLAFSQ